MPEKTINDLPRDLKMLHAKASDALQRENQDYAIELYTQILTREPLVYEIRKTLRAAQQTKAGARGGLFKRAFSSASSSPQLAKAQMALRSKPLEAIAIAETILNTDPNNASAHKIIAEAAMASQMPKEAVMSFEILVKNSPKDRQLTFQYAEALADAGQKTQGERALMDLLRQFPGDQEINTKLKDLSARKTLDEGGYDALADGSGSYRDVLRNKAEAVSLEQAGRSVKTDDAAGSLISEWEAKIQSDPNNIKILRNLAETYAQRADFDKSIAYFERIQAVEGGADPSLYKQIADVKLKKYDGIIAKLDINAVDYQEKLAALNAEKQSFQLEECRLRSERYPTDLQIRFELGALYFDAGKVTEAIQEFQRAQANPNRRIASITYLAKCFEKRGMNDLAARRLQEVLKEKVGFDDEKKDLIYTLGCVLDKMGKKEEAMEQFKMIYEVDIGYRDISKRVDDYYAAGGT